MVNSLNGSLSDEIKQLTQLEILFLKENELTGDLPIASFQSLTELDKKEVFLKQKNGFSFTNEAQFTNDTGISINK